MRNCGLDAVLLLSLSGGERRGLFKGRWAIPTHGIGTLVVVFV